MSDSGLQVVFGADAGGLTQGVNQAKAAIASLGPAVSAAQASLANFGAATAKAFAPPNVDAFAGAVSQVAAATGQISASVVGATIAIRGLGAGATAAAQQTAPLAQGLAASGASVSVAAAALMQFGARAQAAATASASVNVSFSATQSTMAAPSGAVSAAGTAFAPIAAAISRLAAPMGQLAQLATPLSGALSAVRGAAQSVGDVMSGVAGAVSGVSGALSGISGAAQSVAGVFSGISSAISSVSSAFAGVSTAAQSIATTFSGVSTAVDGVNGVIGSFNGVLQSLKGLVDAGTQALGGARGAVVAFNAAADANPVGLISLAIQTLIGWITELIDWLKKIGALGDAWDALKAGADLFVESLKIVWDWLKIAATAIGDVLTGHWLFDNLRAGFANLSADIRQSTADAVRLGQKISAIGQKAAQGGSGGSPADSNLPPPLPPASPPARLGGGGGKGAHTGSGVDQPCDCDPTAAAECAKRDGDAEAGALQQADANVLSDGLATGNQLRSDNDKTKNDAIQGLNAVVTNTQAANTARLEDTKNTNAQVRQDNDNTVKELKSSMDGLVSSFSKGLLAMVEGTKSFGQVMRSLGQQVLNDAVKWIDQAVEKWLWAQTEKVLASQQGQAILDALGLRDVAMAVKNAAAKVAANATGNAAIIVSNTTTAAAGQGVALAQTLMIIKQDAAKVFGGIFAALSQNPVTLPAAAPLAAAGMASVLAVSVAAGGFDVPAGVNPLTQLHAQEMVLPARLANPMRDMLASYGSASAPAAGGHSFSFGDTHIHGAPNMSPSDFKQALSEHRSNVAEAVAGALRGGWRPSYKQPVGAL